MRKKIVAGNWKMHKNAAQTEDLLNELIAKIPAETNAQVIVAPTFVNLASAVNHLKSTAINVAAQNMPKVTILSMFNMVDLPIRIILSHCVMSITKKFIPKKLI